MSDNNSDTYKEDIFDQSEYIDYNLEQEEEEYEKEKIEFNNNSFIANDLITFSEEMGLCLCEYIEHETIDDFINHITKTYQ